MMKSNLGSLISLFVEFQSAARIQYVAEEFRLRRTGELLGMRECRLRSREILQNAVSNALVVEPADGDF